MDQPRGENGQWVSVEKYVLSIVDERFSGLRRELALDRKALDLQAAEYARRLEDLNHAHARAQDALNTFVSIDKYETQMETMEDARKLALNRLDEKVASVDKTLTAKLDDYITKAEARQAEMDQAIALGKGAAQEAQRAAEEQGRQSAKAAEAQHRKTNRNMALVTIALTIIIAVSQWLGTGATP